MKLGEKIINLRKEHNLTQEDLADILNISRQTISNWENNRSYPDMEMLIKISNKFQISLDDLLKGDIEMVKKIDKNLKMSKDAKIAISILSIIILIIISLITYYVIGSFREEKKIEEIKNNLAKTTKIIIGDKLKIGNDNMKSKEGSFGIIKTIEDEKDIQELLNIFSHIKKESNLDNLSNTNTRYLFRFIDNAQNIIADVSFSPLNIDGINTFFHLGLDDDNDLLLYNIMREKYNLPLSNMNSNLANSLLTTNKIVIKNWNTTHVIKEITEEQKIKELIEVISKAKLSNQKEFLAIGLKYTLELYHDEKIIGLLNYEPYLFLNSEDVSYTLYDYNKELLNTLIEND